MRGTIIILALFMLGGCGTTVSLEELEAQALVTGDWSLVEKRESIIAKRRSRDVQCPQGSFAYCESYASIQRCNCIARGDVYSFSSGGR